jgi:hypothetical protein
MGKKKPNPKDVLAGTRLDLTLISPAALIEEALAMVEGQEKYGMWNFRAATVSARVYCAAIQRHALKYLHGKEYDPKTGVHHLGSVRASAGIILEAKAMGTLIDDRPISLPNIETMIDEAEQRVKHLKQLFKNYHPKHYTLDQLK